MAIQISLEIKNKALNRAFREVGVNNNIVIFGASSGGVMVSDDYVVFSFNEANNGTLSISGIIQLAVTTTGVGNIIKRLYFKDSAGTNDIISFIELDEADWGDFTATAGTYQINSLDITIV